MVLYGRGAASVGEQLGKTREEAQEIIDKFFKAFPDVHKWIANSIQGCHESGYVEDIAGRRRRLPDILLPKYQITDVNQSNDNILFNPLFDSIQRSNDRFKDLKEKYLLELSKIKNRKEYEVIQEKAKAEGIEIHDNTGFIAQAERQAVNSRVQGGAATLTKQALIDIFHDRELNELGAYLINTVHDEILIEAPAVNAEKAAQRLTTIMVDAAKKYVDDVPMSCDPYVTTCWYLDEFATLVQSEFKHMLDDGKDPMQAFEELCEIRTESTRDQLYEIVGGFLPQMPDNVKIIHTLS